MKQGDTLQWPSAVSAAPSSSTTADAGDVALARLCGAGDKAACEHLVDQYQQMVYALGCQLLSDPDEALDLSQEVFLRVFRTIGRFEGRAALKTWIYRIVINGARNRRRWYHRRRRAYLVPLDVHVSEHGELPSPRAAASPEVAFDRKENERRLWRAIAGLPLEQRSALILREIHGLRYKEIAFSLGVTTSAVKSRLSRARDTPPGVEGVRTRLSCAAVRRKLGAHHDGELAIEAQVAVEAHCSRCAACSERLRAFSDIRGLLRRGAGTGDSWAEAEVGRVAAVANTLPATLASVVLQALNEKREEWPRRVGRLMLGAPRVWIPGGALAVSVAGAAVLATILSLYTPIHTRSLAAVIDPGSNHNPVMVAGGVTLPQVSLDAGLALFLNEPLELPTPNLALAALVTREGEVTSLEVLSPRVSAEELVGSLSRLTTNVRFKPAVYGGSPVAVNVVWLFEQTTVRPSSPQREEDQTAPSLTS